MEIGLSLHSNPQISEIANLLGNSLSHFHLLNVQCNEPIEPYMSFLGVSRIYEYPAFSFNLCVGVSFGYASLCRLKCLMTLEVCIMLGKQFSRLRKYTRCISN